MFISVNTSSIPKTFKGSTLIIPAISVGNVGQLACDLLIATLDVEKVGYFCSPCFLPIVGNNPFASSLQAENSNTPCLSSEVYYSSTSNLAVVQLRSPLVKGKQSEFRSHLLKWMKECEFAELIILSSCHAFERSDEQLIGAAFRYLISPAHKDAKQCISQLSWKEMEERAVGYGDRSLFLPGGGYTKKLFQACCEAEVPCVVLLLFCAEGNNIPEAMSIVDHLNQWKHYIDEKTKKWTSPPSWAYLFGNMPPSGIF